MCYVCTLRVLTGRFDYEKNDIMVFKKKNKCAKLCFSGRGVVDAPFTAVAEFFNDIESCFVWDTFLVVS